MPTLRELLGYGRFVVKYQLMANITATMDIKASSKEEAEAKFKRKYPKKQILDTRTVY